METTYNEQNKCGEIFYNKYGKLNFLCFFCNKCINNYNQYENHIISKHLEELSHSTLKREFWIKQENDYDVEEFPIQATPTNEIFHEIFPENEQTVQLKIEIDEKAVKFNHMKFEKYTGEVLFHYNNEIEENGEGQLKEKIDDNEGIILTNKRKQKYPQNQCNYCDKIFSQPQHVYTHNTTFRNERNKCSICGQRLCGVKQYQEHHLAVHNLLIPSQLPNWKRISINKINENDTTTKTDVVNKKSKSLTVKYFECDICKKITDTYCNIVRHMRKHSGEKPFQCELCLMKFVQKSSLQLHMRNIHTHERPYQCTECGKWFPFVRILNTHIRRIHRKHERIHQPCPICGKMFSTSDKIKLHLTTHSTERPFSCTKCEKKFKNIQTLRQHETIHSETKLFPCPYCDMNFAQWSGRSSHIKRAHSIITIDG